MISHHIATHQIKTSPFGTSFYLVSRVGQSSRFARFEPTSWVQVATRPTKKQNRDLKVSFRFLVSRVGLEPTTPSLRGSCSNQLSYRPKYGLHSPLSCDVLPAPRLVLFSIDSATSASYSQLSYRPKIVSPHFHHYTTFRHKMEPFFSKKYFELRNIKPRLLTVAPIAAFDPHHSLKVHLAFLSILCYNYLMPEWRNWQTR